MKIIAFKYSLIKEAEEFIKMLSRPNEYKNLRSVIWPTPDNIIKFANSSGRAIAYIQQLWEKYFDQISIAFNKLDTKDPGNIVCYLHGISCEGWFDVDDNSIHIRYPGTGEDRELLDTMIHEVIHLSTYNSKLTYEERENLVDKYMESKEIRNILSSVGGF